MRKASSATSVNSLKSTNKKKKGSKVRPVCQSINNSKAMFDIRKIMGGSPTASNKLNLT